MNPPTIAKHASSASGHWYDQHGNQIAEVPTANGKGTKKPTLREARVNDWACGVTSILAMADKPALTTWKQKQAILAALTLPRMVQETEDDWIARVVEDAGEHARKAAEVGTEVHAAIQRSFQGQAFDDAYKAHVQGVRQMLMDVAPNAAWKSEVGCASAYGYGTKADLFSEQWLVDFKGKDGDKRSIDEESLYDEHHMQLAATREALSSTTFPPQRCGIMFFSRTHPGVCCLVESKKDELERGMEMFLSLLRYWRAKNKHRPSWATKE